MTLTQLIKVIQSPLHKLLCASQVYGGLGDTDLERVGVHIVVGTRMVGVHSYACLVVYLLNCTDYLFASCRGISS